MVSGQVPKNRMAGLPSAPLEPGAQLVPARMRRLSAGLRATPLRAKISAEKGRHPDQASHGIDNPLRNRGVRATIPWATSATQSSLSQR